MRKLSILFLATMLFIKVNGQSCEACNAALVKDVLEQSNNLYVSAKYLESISEHEYNELKRNGSAGVDIPILKGLISGSASYDEFQKKIKEFTRRIESETTIWSQISYKDTRTSPMAYNAWSKCMEDCNSRPGVYLIKSYDGEDYGMFKIKYVPAPRESDSIFCKLTFASEDSVYTQTAIVYKNGNTAITYRRKFKNNVSTTLVSTNASQTLNGGVSYSDNFKSTYIKPSGLKVLSLEYTYLIRLTKTEVGSTARSCMWGNSGLSGIGRMVSCIQQNGREMKKSCDDKWPGDIATISVTPSPGYQFSGGLGYDNLKLGGPMAEWNWGQRCLGKNDFVVADTKDLKQMKVWLHKEVDARLQAPSFKDSIAQETAFANVDELGRISFSIPTNRLNSYDIHIILSSGSVIHINPNNVNDYAYLNFEGDKTRFTLRKVDAFFQ